MLYISFYALYMRLSMCNLAFAIPGHVCNLFIAGGAQAPARAATVTTCDPAASLSDREVETNFSACLASAQSRSTAIIYGLRFSVWRHNSAICPDVVQMNDHRQKSALQESNRERCTKHAKKGGFTPPVLQFLE